MLGTDPLAGQRTDIRADYLGDFPADNYASAFVDAVHNVSRKPMEDMEDDQTEDAATEQAGRDEDDKSAVEEDGEGALPGRSWSKYAQIAARVGLDLAGTAIALIALAAALVGGPSWVTALLGCFSLGGVSVGVGYRHKARSMATPPHRRRCDTGCPVVTLAVTAHQTGQLSWRLPPHAECC